MISPKILLLLLTNLLAPNIGASMKILCITHTDFEIPGVIQDWAIQNGHEFSICSPYKDKQWHTKHNNFDFLLIMGGPQSACIINETYLKDEISFIEKAIVNKKIVLGVCLGAQLIGNALGAAAEKSPEKEVGIYSIQLTDDGKSDPLLKDFPEIFDVMHWHNDMPGLTPNATVLAFSAGCPRQIIRYGEKIYGFQCHFEITKSGIKAMVEHCPESLVPTKFTQSRDELLGQEYNTINEKIYSLLDRLTSL